MRFSTPVSLLALLTLGLLFFAYRFAVSDVVDPDAEILALKPWRPMARLAFGTVTIPLILFFSFWLASSLRRIRHPRSAFGSRA